MHVVGLWHQHITSSAQTTHQNRHPPYQNYLLLFIAQDSHVPVYRMLCNHATAPISDVQHLKISNIYVLRKQYKKVSSTQIDADTTLYISVHSLCLSLNGKMPYFACLITIKLCCTTYWLPLSKRISQHTNIIMITFSNIYNKGIQ